MTTAEIAAHVMLNKNQLNNILHGLWCLTPLSTIFQLYRNILNSLSILVNMLMYCFNFTV